MSETPAVQHHRRHLPRPRWFALAGLGVVVVAWLASAIADSVADIDLTGVDHPYALVGAFVVFDAVIPIFPSESLLNAGSILATEDGSSIQLWKLIVAGSLGAVIGDSILYWISRTFLRGFAADRVAQAQKNPKVEQTLEVLDGQAPQLIVFGRFVPGMRFVVGATMGLTKFPYARFLLWDAIGGTSWAAFTCVSSALVATVVGGQPILSMVISVVLTTALLGVLYRSLEDKWNESNPDEPSPAPVAGDA